MNKVKMFFVAAALVLTTAGVFAGKAKFVNYQLEAYSGGTYYPLTSAAVSLTDLTTTASGSQAKIVSSSSSTNYALYGNISGTYTALYTTGF